MPPPVSQPPAFCAACPWLPVQSPVDLATGKAKAYFFLNPPDVLDKQVAYDAEWRDLNLYEPGVLVDSNGAESKLRLASGDVVTVKSDGLVKCHKQDFEGVNDILLLDNFSEQSLLHTIRVRFRRVRWVPALRGRDPLATRRPFTAGAAPAPAFSLCATAGAAPPPPAVCAATMTRS